MAVLRRSNGVTILEIGNVTLKTDKINRFRYNNLRKKEKITMYDFLSATGGLKKKK